MINYQILLGAILLILSSGTIVVQGQDMTNEGSENVKAKKRIFTSEVSGNFRGDYRYFPEEGLYSGQRQEYFSTVFNPEVYIDWNKGKQLVQFKGFGRLNQYDTKQSHWDIRELYYLQVYKKWEYSVGVKQIYWGFTESNHLTNIINQDDFLEGNDIDNKRGQPMVHLSFTPKWGVVDVIGMTYFRDLKFPGVNGRGRPPFEISANEGYESDNEEYNLDVAVRWSHSIKSMDIGLSHFYGTTRAPIFNVISSSETLAPMFVPYYELINQTGLELQVTTGGMLWKLEAINRFSDRKTIRAFTAGGEYTFSNVFKTDLGLLLEYNYDDRGDELLSGLNDDIFAGMRIGFNDKQSSDFLGGANIDLEKGTILMFAEANRRLGDSWKATVKAVGFENIKEEDFLYLVRKDGYIEVSLAKYF